MPLQAMKPSTTVSPIIALEKIQPALPPPNDDEAAPQNLPSNEGTHSYFVVRIGTCILLMDHSFPVNVWAELAEPRARILSAGIAQGNCSVTQELAGNAKFQRILIVHIALCLDYRLMSMVFVVFFFFFFSVLLLDCLIHFPWTCPSVIGDYIAGHEKLRRAMIRLVW
ncbi:hypothetical protein POTOM_002401 [Populus tomentosa]|uniref:Uncharacterized protein n=1 Tax=Populus tomentosa TaxID=118781 RepID=A0A8X8DJU3_POPTO|nr:hypothetical protein POTOM_002401 [Populus tomentosa]